MGKHSICCAFVFYRRLSYSIVLLSLYNFIFYVNCSIIKIYGVIKQFYQFKEENNMEKAMMMKKFGEKYPKVKAILDQVQASKSIDQNDKD